MTPEVIAVITARGGSKSIPRKNIQLLGGRPLIAWTVAAALASRRLSRVIVSTDDHEIASLAREAGAEAPFLRPASLAQDNSPHIGALSHAIEWLDEQQHSRPEYVMTLQPTSPFRTAEDIDGAIAVADANDAVAVASVCAMTPHPYLAKTIADDGTLGDFLTLPKGYLPRQSFPPAYCLNGAISLNKRRSLLAEGLYLPPGTLAYVMPPERSLDIDTWWDLRLANLIALEHALVE